MWKGGPRSVVRVEGGVVFCWMGATKERGLGMDGGMWWGGRRLFLRRGEGEGEGEGEKWLRVTINHSQNITQPHPISHATPYAF